MKGLNNALAMCCYYLTVCFSFPSQVLSPLLTPQSRYDLYAEVDAHRSGTGELPASYASDEPVLDDGADSLNDELDVHTLSPPV